MKDELHTYESVKSEILDRINNKRINKLSMDEELISQWIDET